MATKREPRTGRSVAVLSEPPPTDPVQVELGRRDQLKASTHAAQAEVVRKGLHAAGHVAALERKITFLEETAAARLPRLEEQLALARRAQKEIGSPHVQTAAQQVLTALWGERDTAATGLIPLLRDYPEKLKTWRRKVDSEDVEKYAVLIRRESTNQHGDIEKSVTQQLARLDTTVWPRFEQELKAAPLGA